METDIVTTDQAIQMVKQRIADIEVKLWEFEPSYGLTKWEKIERDNYRDLLRSNIEMLKALDPEAQIKQ